MKYEEVIEEIGGCGCYQKWILSALYLIALVDGLQATILVLLVPNTKHRCAIPGWINDTFEEQNENHKEAIDAFIPQHMEDDEVVYSCCYIYGNDALGNNKTRHKCNSWVYDKSVFQSSFTSDMNLVCGREEFKTYFMLSYFLGAFAATLTCGWLSDRIFWMNLVYESEKFKNLRLILCFLIGIFASILTCGWLSDGFGRKPIIIVTLIAQGICSIAISQMTRMEPIFFLRFLASWGGTGVYIPSAVFGTEISSTSQRKSASVAIHMSYTIGCMLLVLMAYFIRTWDILVLLISLPSLPLAFIYLWILPESPRWLLSIQKTKKAVNIFENMAKWNKRKFTPYSENEINVSTPTSRTVKLWKMFTIPILLKRTLISMFGWATINFVYYGLVLNVGNLSGNIYLNIFFNAATEIPGYILCMVLLNRVGRKKLYIGFMVTAGLMGIAAIFPVLYGSKDLQWILTVLSALIRLCMAGCFGIIYLLTCELYPTIIRNASLGTISTFGKIGSIVSPYILKSTTLAPGKIGKSLPLVVMGAVCFISGSLVNILPETTNQNLHENFEEIYREEDQKKRNREEMLNIPLSTVFASDKYEN